MNDISDLTIFIFASLNFHILLAVRFLVFIDVSLLSFGSFSFIVHSLLPPFISTQIFHHYNEYIT